MCPAKPEDGIVSPGAGAQGGCELPSVGVGRQTWMLWISSKCF